MDNQLHDLLGAVKAEAPPLGRSADDVLATGRLVRRRRRAAWTGAATLGVVIAVAAATSVPQYLAARPQRTGAAAPAAAEAKQKPATISYPAAQFTYGLSGYRVGPFTITPAQNVTPGYQVAFVSKAGVGTSTTDTNKAVHPTVPAVGILTLYRPGVFDPSAYKSAEAVQVAGQPGKYDPKARWTTGRRGANQHPGLAWQYGDNAWATLNSDWDGVFTEQNLIDIAAGLKAAPEQAVTVAFKPGYLPAGWHLVSAGLTSEAPGVVGLVRSGVRLVQVPLQYTQLREPLLAGSGDKPVQTFELTVYPAWYSNSIKTADPSCTSPGVCYRKAGKYMIEAAATGTLANSVLLKVLNGLQVANIDDASTWFTAAEVFPTK
jgi:hypothetical protein